MLLIGVVDQQQFIIDPILILCVQHLFVLYRHANKNIYILIEIVLEAWFEWSILSNYENIVRNHWTVVLATSVMLFAHWMYFAAGGLSLLNAVQPDFFIHLFDVIDPDGDGFLDKEEVYVATKSCGIQLTRKELDLLVE